MRPVRSPVRAITNARRTRAMPLRLMQRPPSKSTTAKRPKFRAAHSPRAKRLGPALINANVLAVTTVMVSHVCPLTTAKPGRVTRRPNANRLVRENTSANVSMGIRVMVPKANVKRSICAAQRTRATLMPTVQRPDRVVPHVCAERAILAMVCNVNRLTTAKLDRSHARSMPIVL